MISLAKIVLGILVDIVLAIIISYIAVICVIYFHEGGHYITARALKLKVTGFRIVHFFKVIPAPTAVHIEIKDKDVKNITVYYIKYILVLIDGIIAGAIPIILFGYYTNEIYLVVMYGLLYMIPCRGDIKDLVDLARGRKPYETEEATVHIPESEEECNSLHPDCSKCGYYMVDECTGDKSIFPDRFNPNDITRLSKVLRDIYE